jgi:multisubunit Na+/H+ antiporter MnhB subunit
MRAGEHLALRIAAKLYAPLALLFALALMALRDPGGGVGFIAALAFSFALVLHVLVFGAAAARAALPPLAARLLLALGVIAALAGAGLPHWPYAAQLIEAGVFLATFGAIALALAALIGRAPTLRDEEW